MSNVLESLKEQYDSSCFRGQYIKEINRITQRSLCSVGEFNKEGVEMASITCKTDCDVVVVEPGNIVVAQVVEISQAHANTLKLVVCKGIGDMSMLRVYITIESATHDKLQFSTGQVLLCTVQHSMYRDNVIHVIAQPFTLHNASMTFEIDANENNAVVDRIKHEIRELRTKLLTHESMVDKILPMIFAKQQDQSKLIAKVEDIDFTQQQTIQFSPLGLFTAKSASIPEGEQVTYSIKSKDPQFMPLNILQTVHMYISVLYQLASTIKTDKELLQFQQYLTTVQDV